LEKKNLLYEEADQKREDEKLKCSFVELESLMKNMVRK
jgi:hypothetical protein